MHVCVCVWCVCVCAPLLLFAFCQVFQYHLKINYLYFVYICYIWSVCSCQSKFSTVYVHNFTIIQLDQKEVKMKSTSKVNKIKKKSAMENQVRENPSIKMKLIQL